MSSYDYWKTTNPDDEWLGPEPESEEFEEPDQAVQERAAAHAAQALYEHQQNQMKDETES